MTHGPPGVLNLVTGVCGLAAMLWLYGVAWHQPMADSIAWARTTITDALPSSTTLLELRRQRLDRRAHVVDADARDRAAAAAKAPASPTPRRAAARPDDLVDRDLAAQFAERRNRIAVVKVEGPRMLRAGNWRRAGELCRTWTDLDLGNPEAWRCLGSALQAQGYHQEAIAAFRKAKQFDPTDRTLDAAIDRSQRGIVADFINRYRQ